MTRALHANLGSAIASGEVHPFLAVQLNFARGAAPVRIWSGPTTMNLGGFNYSGVGTLLGVSPITETTDSRAVGMSVTLSGVPSSFVNDSAWSKFQGDTVDVFFGALSDNGVVLGEPLQIFKGIINNMPITEYLRDGESFTTITVNLETYLLDIGRSRESRYTPEDQKRRYPDDKFFDFIADLQTKQITWG